MGHVGRLSPGYWAAGRLAGRLSSGLGVWLGSWASGWAAGRLAGQLGVWLGSWAFE
jgi:hypothetical protein